MVEVESTEFSPSSASTSSSKESSPAFARTKSGTEVGGSGVGDGGDAGVRETSKPEARR